MFLSKDFIVPDKVLIALAESQPPLKSLVLGAPMIRGYTMETLTSLLSVCPSLVSLGREQY